MKALETHLAFLAEHDLPTGPPLNLERAGRATELLTPFVLPERLERLRAVLSQRTRRFTLLLEEVHDAHNIAACVRTCDAFGLQDLHIIPPPDKPLRLSRLVSTGAHRWLTIHIHDDLDAAREALASAGYRLAVTDVQEGVDGTTPPRIELTAPLCLAFGNERAGASEALREAAELCLHIPMAGFVRSLNISVALAISVARIRERLDEMPPEVWRLAEPEERTLLDSWILADVPHAPAVLEEISKRR